MAIIKKYGKPDLFITFTCNPKLRRITENLYPDQTANERPDLVIRVFKLKLNNLLNDIFKHGVLGKVVTHVQVIEFIYNVKELFIINDIFKLFAFYSYFY